MREKERGMKEREGEGEGTRGEESAKVKKQGEG